MSISTLSIGHAAEYLVCYDLALRGLHAAPNIFEHCVYDVIADHKGQMLRIQVKGTMKPHNKNQFGYQYNLHGKDYSVCDLIALVAIDTKQVMYIRPPKTPLKSIYKKFENVDESNKDILNMIFKNENIKS